MNVERYYWPDGSAALRQCIVVDEQGRYGIGYTADAERIWAYPVGLPKIANAHAVPGAETLPGGATVITATLWRRARDGTYSGNWVDDPIERCLTIVSDLGWRMPDYIAHRLLAGSDQPGHWDYGATVGYIPGTPPVQGQARDEMTIDQAVDCAREVGAAIASRTIRHAAQHGNIPGARKRGRDWLVSYDGLFYYLDHRPRRGRKRK